MGAPPATVRWFPTTKLGSQAVRSDAAAFTAAYQRNQQALYRYCVSILHDEHDAQDALQSAAMKAFAALQAEEREFELRPWLFRIVHNEAITMLRRRRGTTTLDGTEPGRGEIEDRVAEREELRLLRADLADLPERQRAALVLRELNGLSHGEIGLVLDLSPPAVKQALFDARTALFDARAGRALACEDVRRTVSDGDGRVLRGRMVRAHLRSCAGCRGFRAQLTARPHALRLLAPPLPAAGAASLLSQVLGASAAKVLVCVAIAGGGSTVAALEFQHRPAPARAVAHVAPVKRVSARVGRPSPRPASTPAGSGRSASARSVTVQSGSRSSPVALPERRDAGRATRRIAATPRATAATPVTVTERPAPPKSVSPPTRAEEPAAPPPDTGGSVTPPSSPGTGPGDAAPPSQRSAPAPHSKDAGAEQHAASAPTKARNGNPNPDATGKPQPSTRLPEPPSAPGHSGQSGAPGNSENAPGHADGTGTANAGGNGNSANAPGHADGNAGGNGNSASAPGHADGNAGGNGNSANAPGHDKPVKPPEAAGTVSW